jgi:hypothetical protein
MVAERVAFNFLAYIGHYVASKSDQSNGNGLNAKYKFEFSNVSKFKIVEINV